MTKLKTLFAIFILLNVITTFGQDEKTKFGLKVGANFAKYTPEVKLTEYEYKLGYYVGGFANIAMDKNFKFQPEFLFALQGTDVLQKDILITDVNGVPMGALPYDFEYTINEYTIVIPLMIQLYILDSLYFETGPQLGFIIDRDLSSSQQLFDGHNSFVPIYHSDDTFDFGVSLGMGYNFTKDVAINFRAYSGLTKRDNDIKSFVLNLGVECKL